MRSDEIRSSCDITIAIAIVNHSSTSHLDQTQQPEMLTRFALYAALVAFSATLAQATTSNTKESQLSLMQDSLTDLLNELAAIKSEASNRLTSARQNRIAGDERIRQTKVSRFVLNKVTELEQESISLKEELVQLFAKTKDGATGRLTIQSKGNTHAIQTSRGFDLEQLKRLGKEIGKRLDQLGKDTAKNLADLVDGVKLVFRDPPPRNDTGTDSSPDAASEAREASRGRGATPLPPAPPRCVHPVPLVPLDHHHHHHHHHYDESNPTLTTPSLFPSSPIVLLSPNRTDSPAPLTLDTPTTNRALGAAYAVADPLDNSLLEGRAAQSGGESIRGVHEESMVLVDRLIQNYLSNLRRAINRITRYVDHRVPAVEAARYKRETGQKRVKRQNSPLWDRIPPRGTELWRDFWDTVRKQVRRINQEFRRISHDMGRLLTGQPALKAYMASEEGVATNDEIEAASNRLEEAEQQEQFDKINVFDEMDDEFTRSELQRNVALRQQIQQEIGVFGSIFEMMQAFVKRLRETARNLVRDVLDPNGSPNNNNNDVTPGPDIRPQVDKLLEETIEAQRNINSQSKPVYLPNDRHRNMG